MLVKFHAFLSDMFSLVNKASRVYVMYQNISDWLTVDYLIAYKVLLTACHICFTRKKHHLGLRPRGHSYTLPICPNNLCKLSFILRCLFRFL